MKYNTKNSITIILSGILSFFLICTLVYFLFKDLTWISEKKEIQKEYLERIFSSSGLWTLASIVISSPIAFAIWRIRDIYALEKIENERRSNNLAEFAKISDLILSIDYEKILNNKEHFVQTSTIYNILPYYKGEKGTDFSRPAGELLKNAWNILNKRNIENLQRLDINEKEYFQKLKKIADDFKYTCRHPLGNAIIQVIFHEKGKYIKNALGDFNYFNFTGLNLSELTDENLIQNITEFFRTNLQCCEFNFDLSGANLELSKLSGLIYTKKKIHRAVLKNADLDNGDFTQTEFNGSNLKKANLNNSVFEHSNFTACKLKKAKIENSSLPYANFSESTLKKTYFINTNLSEAKFLRTNLENTYIINCNLEKSIFYDSNLYGVNFMKTKPPKDLFSSIKSLFGCIFLKSDLEKTGISLENAKELQKKLGFIILIDRRGIHKKKYKIDDTYILECNYNKFINLTHKLININIDIPKSNKENEAFGWKIRKLLKPKYIWQNRI